MVDKIIGISIYVWFIIAVVFMIIQQIKIHFLKKDKQRTMNSYVFLRNKYERLKNKYNVEEEE